MEISIVSSRDFQSGREHNLARERARAKKRAQSCGLSPHQRIMRAAANGTGVRLDAYEVLALSCDHAIYTAAENGA